jgi:hypothetical protein
MEIGTLAHWIGYRRYQIIYHAVLAHREFPIESLARFEGLDALHVELGITEILPLPVIYHSDDTSDSDSGNSDCSRGKWHRGPIPNPACLARSNNNFLYGQDSSDDTF